MTPVCPSGHSSATTDYCDQCGVPIAVASTPAGTSAEAPVIEEADTSPTAFHEPCPSCGAYRSGDDRYCEGCGHDFLAPSQGTEPAWEAVVDADRSQFERFAVVGLPFPRDYPERRFTLGEAEVRIGR